VVKSNGSFFPWMHNCCLYLHCLLSFIPVQTVCVKCRVNHSYGIVFHFYWHYCKLESYLTFSQEREPCVLYLVTPRLEGNKANLQRVLPLRGNEMA